MKTLWMGLLVPMLVASAAIAAPLPGVRHVVVLGLQPPAAWIARPVTEAFTPRNN